MEGAQFRRRKYSIFLFCTLLGAGLFGTIFFKKAGEVISLLKDKHGIDPKTIDKVILTHGHLDHIGWLITPKGEKGEEFDVTFPNAELVIGENEWKLWNGEGKLCLCAFAKGSEREGTTYPPHFFFGWSCTVHIFYTQKKKQSGLERSLYRLITYGATKTKCL